jgi:hypothetical protein
VSAGIWPALHNYHPLYLFYLNLDDIIGRADYNEMWGITLKPIEDSTDIETFDFHTLLILQKFLRSNENDVDLAKEQLQRTLIWRKKFDPVKAMGEIFSKENFSGLGYVTTIHRRNGDKEFVTWNIYGAVEDYTTIFEPFEE